MNRQPGALTTVDYAGTGSFGDAEKVPNLSVLELGTGEERIAPIDVPCETVAAWIDASAAVWAAVTSGNTCHQGSDGITFIVLSDFQQRHLEVPDHPHGVVSHSGA